MSAPTAPPETEVTAPAPEEPQTDAPETPVEEIPESDAAPSAEAAVPVVEVTEPVKPDTITRDEWEKERTEVAQKAAADALEADRRRRQTENARIAKMERQEREEAQEATDILKAVLGARGIYEMPEDSATAAIDRIARKKAERMSQNALDTVDQAWDYLVSPVYGKEAELADEAEAAARRLSPKLQQFITAVRPQIEAEARKGYVPESDLPKIREAAVAAHLAKQREGETELTRVEGAPSTTNTSSIEYWERRVAHEGEEGFPEMSNADWATYRQLRAQHGY